MSDSMIPHERLARGEATLPELLRAHARTRGDQVALREKNHGIWQGTTWAGYEAAARHVALGLMKLGLVRGDRIIIAAEDVPAWFFADLGAQMLGVQVVGIYPTNPWPEVQYIARHCQAKVAITGDQEQTDKVLDAMKEGDGLPFLEHVFCVDMKGLRRYEPDRPRSFDALIELGQLLEAEDPLAAQRLDASIESLLPDDVNILVYTSGTTGPPKGAMLTHRNFIYGAHAYAAARGMLGKRFESVCYLPLCHVAERIVGVYTALLSGTRLNFVENPETVPENVREIAPTVFGAVPRIWEKFYSVVTIRVREATRVAQLAYKLAIGIGYKVAAYREEQKPVPAHLAAAFWLARVLVLNNIRKAIGVHRARLLITGAAPTSPDLIRWYMALGLDMVEVWGQTECGGIATSNPISRVKPGSIGMPLPQTEVKVSPEGELLIRSPSVFMGYLNQPEKTAEALRDGWLHTGDVGRMDNEGFFYITDRMKDIIITAGGKNITPSEIENQLKFSPYITDAVVIGDRRPFLAALVMIDHENVEKFAQDNSIPFSNYQSLCRRPEIQELIEGEIAKVNAKFARVEQVRKFRLIEQKLTAEDEELTPTMKLKRKLVNEKYRELIEGMYAREAA